MTPKNTSVVVGSLVLIAGAAGASAAQGQGQGNQKDAVTLEAKPAIVVFGTPTVLSGRVTGKDTAGVRVGLARDPFPYGNGFLDLGETTTAANSQFSFTTTPAVSTQYRATAKTSPPVTSALVTVGVRPRVGLRLSTAMPSSGSLVRFSGSVHPAHDGRIASIQKRSATGRWSTVARTTLRDAGETRSAFSRRLRLNRDGVYRVKVAAHDDHLNGLSRTRSIDVR